MFRITVESIQWRTGLRFLNEAARCLEEKIITSPVGILSTLASLHNEDLISRLMEISEQYSA